MKDQKEDNLNSHKEDRGNSNTISTSNTRKITATIKKRKENGIRCEDIGSNPHSNGEVFSRSQ